VHPPLQNATQDYIETVASLGKKGTTRNQKAPLA